MSEFIPYYQHIAQALLCTTTVEDGCDYQVLKIKNPTAAADFRPISVLRYSLEWWRELWFGSTSIQQFAILNSLEKLWANTPSGLLAQPEAPAEIFPKGAKALPKHSYTFYISVYV